MSIPERDYRVLTSGLALCAGLAVVYAFRFPGPIPVSTAVVRDAVVFAILAIIADEMSVEVSDRVTLSAGQSSHPAGDHVHRQAAGHRRRHRGRPLGRLA